jgi:hypothetical protein
MAWRLRFDITFSLALCLRILAFLLSAGLFAFSVWYVWAAFTVPVELEIREGTVWLHALAKRVGVDLYDSSRVAFVNMNHGPMDAILKGWLATIFPGLPGCMVTRCFVLLLPFCLLGSAYVLARRNLTDALLAAGALQLFFANLTVMLVVGRSDATVLCGLAICAALTHALLVNRHQEWSNRRYVALQVLLGSSSAVVFLTSWRIVPTLATMQLVVLAKQLAESRSRWRRCLLYATALFAAGFALVWVPTFLFELHGHFGEYFRRFFGFFAKESGWGTFAGPAFQLFPIELTQSRQASLVVVAVLMLAALYRLRRERAQLIAWLLLVSLGWVVYAYGFYKNQRGGGLHYFGPFFITAWFLILHALRRRSQARPLVQLIVFGLIACMVPWRGLLDQRRQFAELHAQARTFLQGVVERTGGQPVFGEDTHLFKHKYHDELVDTGDVAAVIAQSRYFGENFSRSFEAYTTTLSAEPPQFVIEGMLDPGLFSGTMTPQFTELLKKHYDVALQGPGNLLANGGGAITLYERKEQ